MAETTTGRPAAPRDTARGIRFPEPPRRGRLLRRYKRFFVDVEDEAGRLVTAHCPNTGSLLGCLAEGSSVWLRDSRDPRRKLRFTWQAVRVGRSWVNVDTSLPNRVVAAATASGALPPLAGYAELRREVPYGAEGRSRIDLLLRAPGRADCYVEVKSTTLADGRTALFPDAVTERGRKHLDELAGVVARGARAVQLFLVSRPDVDRLAPADAIDPAYGETLRAAAAAGVETLALRTRVRARSFEIEEEIPVEL